MTAEQERGDIFDGTAEFHGDEGAVARGVENTGLPDDTVWRKTGDFPCGIDHGIERIADNYKDRVGAETSHLLGDGLDDLDILCQEIVSAHAGLAGQTRSNNHYIAVSGVLVTVGADNVAQSYRSMGADCIRSSTGRALP